MAKTRQMVLNRNYTLTSTQGHSVRFEKGTPVHVPPGLYGEVLALGGEFVDGEGLPEQAVKANQEPLDGVERDQRLLDAVCAIAETNDVDDFTAAGMPKAEAVAKRAGFKATNKDVAKAWQRRADKIAAGEDE